nr:uncharacterized protein LOC128705118 [Cherax quadricarinatus]
MDKPFITTIITIIVTMLQAEIMYNVHNLISVASANPVNPLWLGQNSSFCIKTMWMIICDYKWREEMKRVSEVYTNLCLATLRDPIAKLLSLKHQGRLIANTRTSA